jgi:hypothetical protein
MDTHVQIHRSIGVVLVGFFFGVGLFAQLR